MFSDTSMDVLICSSTQPVQKRIDTLFWAVWLSYSLTWRIDFLFTWKSHARLKFNFGQNDLYEIHTALSFISPQFMWTKIKNWLNTEVRFPTKMKSHTGLSSFCLSYKRSLTASQALEVVYVTIGNSAVCLFLYLTGGHFQGNLQRVGDVSEQKTKCWPIISQKIGGVRL